MEDCLARAGGGCPHEFAGDHCRVAAVPEVDIELAAAGAGVDGDGEATKGDID